MDTHAQKEISKFFAKHCEKELGMMTFGVEDKRAKSEPLTFEKVLELARNLDLLGSGPGRINRPALTQPLFASRLKIITSNLLTVSTPKPLSLFERFRVWVESLADRAEVYYHYPRVQRSILRPDPKAYLLDSHTLVCHPAVYFKIRNSMGLSTD